MSTGKNKDPLLDIFLFETNELIEQLEQIIIESEKAKEFTEDSINEIFRIMHSIKGSSAMMSYGHISNLAHCVEDLFYLIRENKPSKVDFTVLSDLVLESSDFIKEEVSKILEDDTSFSEPDELIKKITNYLSELKNDNSEKSAPEETTQKSNEDISPKKDDSNTQDSNDNYVNSDINDNSNNIDINNMKEYNGVIYFEEDCKMENIRAFSIMNNLNEKLDVVSYKPENLEDMESVEIIRNSGFSIQFISDLDFEEIKDTFSKLVFVKEYSINVLSQSSDEESKEDNKAKSANEEMKDNKADKDNEDKPKSNFVRTKNQNVISINLNKLDTLMDLVGELVISESMVIYNPEIMNLQLDSFNKSARQLIKITKDLQDIVMDLRMIPISSTFFMMNRIVRDMGRKQDKKINLKLVGEETEVDKNIIEHLSDPLIHMIRNSIDHGIESEEERIAQGKPAEGTITLEARNVGSDVVIIVRDDGRGLEKEKIIKKALANGLIENAEEMNDKEIYALILLPGFSTNEEINEYSGRGVGMDVVSKNIDKVGGKVIINSKPGEGTEIAIKIPLTLAIMDGMIIRIGEEKYIIPINYIKRSFIVGEDEIIKDPANTSEMLVVRGVCYPLIRLHKTFEIQTDKEKLEEGIVILVESESGSVCLWADELLGQQQVVVKSLPGYLKKIGEISGCTLLGDGSISLIIDVENLIDTKERY